MKKELISAFVDSELDEKGQQQLQYENRDELNRLVHIYRTIGETIRSGQSRINLSEKFQSKLKNALQQEYSNHRHTAENDDISINAKDNIDIANEESVL